MSLGTNILPPSGSDAFNNLPLSAQAADVEGFATAQTLETDNEASVVATDNAAALASLVNADQANNAATDALTSGAVSGPGVVTLGGDAPPTTGGTSWTTYALYAALIFGGWYLWKKFHKQK
jgi:hypothetical protein